MDSLDPLVPLQPQMFALGYVYICVGDAIGDSFDTGQFNWATRKIGSQKGS